MQAAEMSSVLDLIGSLKDEMSAIRELHGSQPALIRRRAAPGHSLDEPWSPCDPEEVSFYACLTHLH